MKIMKKSRRLTLTKTDKERGKIIRKPLIFNVCVQLVNVCGQTKGGS
jgi:hypothetical protein